LSSCRGYGEQRQRRKRQASHASFSTVFRNEPPPLRRV
jgi:hypothetical protein